MVNCSNKAQNNSSEFIEFAHTGIVRKYTPTLFISTEKLQIHLSEEQMTNLKHMLGKSKVTQQKIEEYINIKYNRVITDSKTFFIIKEFIQGHKNYYTNNIRQNNNPSTESFDVSINGTVTFSIYYKFKNKFFNDLESYLDKKQCGKKVIEALAHL